MVGRLVWGDRVGSASRRLTCNGDPSGLRRLAVFCDSISMTSFTLVVGSIPPCPFKQRRGKDGAPGVILPFVFSPLSIQNADRQGWDTHVSGNTLGCWVCVTHPVDHETIDKDGSPCLGTPDRSRRRPVHSDSISTVPSMPVA